MLIKLNNKKRRKILTLVVETFFTKLVGEDNNRG